MFGIKIKKLVTKKEYTIEDLFEAVKDKQFTAGVPSLTKSGLYYMITFPPLDRNNQVQIYTIKKGPSSKFTVTKAQEAGLGNAVKNNFLSDLTGGWSSASQNFGKTNKECEKLVETTLAELQALDL